MAHSFNDLVVGQRAMHLCIEAYRNTHLFPREEVYVLTSQIRRAAASVASNIAEGQGRSTPGEFLSFPGHARGSLFELQTQILIARELNYLTTEPADELERMVGEVAKPLNGLISALQKGKRASKPRA
jgi:four helix bundle protein